LPLPGAGGGLRRPGSLAERTATHVDDGLIEALRTNRRIRWQPG